MSMFSLSKDGNNNCLHPYIPSREFGYGLARRKECHNFKIKIVIDNARDNIRVIRHIITIT